MANHRVCRVCWQCGSAEYEVRRSAASLTHDRECKQCKTWYSPPTPLWIKAVRVIAGGLLLVSGLSGCILPLFLTLQGETILEVAGIAASAVWLAFGIGLLIRGIGDLREQVTEPIDFSRYSNNSDTSTEN